MIGTLQDFLGPTFIKSLGLTFVHSLWQATLIAGVLYLILQGFSAQEARKRYVASSLALIAVFVSACITFFLYYRSAEQGMYAGDFILIESIGALSEPAAQRGFSFFTEWKLWLEPAFPSIIFCWMVGMILYSGRLAMGAFAIQRLKKSGFPIQKRFQERLSIRARQLGIQQNITCKVTNRVSVPMVIGVAKPIILFPIAMLNQLSMNEVENIMVHELAHIKRMDFFQNIIQSLIESVFYYHPAVWYISNMIRKERENCCDDLVVEICGSSMDYAKALLQVQNNHITHQAPILALSLFRKKKVLLTRIQRILNQPIPKSNIMEKLFATTACLFCFMLLSISSSFKAQTPIQEMTPMVAQEPTEVQGLEIVDDDVVIALGRALVRMASEEPIEMSIDEFAVIKDTIPTKPSKAISKIRKQTDDENIEMELVNGEVKSLKIDGKEIPASEYGKYDAVIAELKAESHYEYVDRRNSNRMAIKKQPREAIHLRTERPTPPTPPTPPSIDELDTPEGRETYKKQREAFLEEMEKYKAEQGERRKRIRNEIDRDRNNIFRIQGDSINYFEFDGDMGDKIILKGNADINFKDGKLFYSADSAVIFEFDTERIQDFSKNFEGQNFKFDHNFNFDNDELMDGRHWEKIMEHMPHLDSNYFNFRYGGDNDQLFERFYNGDSTHIFWNLDKGHFFNDQSEEIIKKLYDGQNNSLWLEKGKDDIYRWDGDQDKHILQKEEYDRAKNLLDRKSGLEYDPSGRNYSWARPFDSESGVENVIINKLLTEGLINRKEGFSITLTPNKLKVNGEKMPESILKKYLKVYESVTGHAMDSDDKLSMTISASAKF